MKILEIYRRSSLAYQLSLSVLLVVLIIFAIFTTFITVRTSRDFQTTVKQDLHKEVKLIATNLEFFHDSLVDSTVKLGDIFFGMFPDGIKLDDSIHRTIGGKSLPVLTYDGHVLNNDFSFPDRFTKMTGGTATIFMRNGDDFIRVSTSLRKQNGERAFGTYLGSKHPGYQKLLNGEPYIGAALLFGKHYMTKYMPFKDASGKVIGILYVGFDYTSKFNLLKQKIASMKFGDTGYAYAIDANPGENQGVLTIHPSLEGKNLLDMTDASGKRVFDKLLDGNSGSFTYMWKNGNDTVAKSKMVDYQRVSGWNWVLAAGSYTSEFTKSSIVLRNTMIAMSILAVIVIVAMIIIILRRRLRPLSKITKIMESMGDGDLTATVVAGDKIYANTQNEIDRISLQSNRMTTQLRELIGGIMTSIDTLNATVSRLGAVMQQTYDGVERQQGETDQVATAINEMSATAQDVARNAVQAAEETRMADGQAKNGNMAVNEVVQSIQSLAQEVEHAAGVISRVEDESVNIGSVLEVIQGIAEQTNLLALNAAIEAARAGDQGRGFAVVADEVRTLAQRTQESTSEIQHMIERLQSSTKDAVDAMGSGQKMAHESVERSRSAGDTLSDITRAVSSITEMNIQIASSAEEQTAVTDELSQRITSIRDVSLQTAESTNEMATAAGELQVVAEQLQANVSRFRI